MGEVVKPMDKKKVLVKVHPEGKFVVDVDKVSGQWTTSRDSFITLIVIPTEHRH